MSIYELSWKKREMRLTKKLLEHVGHKIKCFIVDKDNVFKVGVKCAQCNVTFLKFDAEDVMSREDLNCLRRKGVQHDKKN